MQHTMRKELSGRSTHAMLQAQRLAFSIGATSDRIETNIEIDMKKSLLLLVGIMLFGALVACSGAEEAPADPTAVKGNDNPAVGQPVGAGGGPAVGGEAPVEGAPTGSKPPPPGGRGSKK